LLLGLFAGSGLREAGALGIPDPFFTPGATGPASGMCEFAGRLVSAANSRFGKTSRIDPISNPSALPQDSLALAIEPDRVTYGQALAKPVAPRRTAAQITVVYRPQDQLTE
jgi:hypothetical protein